MPVAAVKPSRVSPQPTAMCASKQETNAKRLQSQHATSVHRLESGAERPLTAVREHRPTRPLPPPIHFHFHFLFPNPKPYLYLMPCP